MTTLLFVFQIANAWTLLGPKTVGWTTRTLVFYVNYSDCSLEPSALNQRLDAAIAAWNHVPGSDLRIERNPDGVLTTAAEVSAGDPHTPLFVCHTNMGALGVPPNSVPASTVVTPDGPISQVVIYLNATDGARANISSVDPGKLIAVFAHEMGHALGLGHSSQSEALMYYSVTNKSDAILTQDDMDGITYLYPRNEFVYGPMGCSSVRYSVDGVGSLLGSISFIILLVTLSRFLGPQGHPKE